MIIFLITLIFLFLNIVIDVHCLMNQVFAVVVYYPLGWLYSNQNYLTWKITSICLLFGFLYFFMFFLH